MGRRSITLRIILSAFSSPLTTTLALATLALACAATPARAAQLDDTFAGRTLLAPGVLTVSSALVGGTPDTLLGMFPSINPAETRPPLFSASPMAIDDDSSTLGDGFASGLFNMPVNADGSIYLGVTGFGDANFDGNRDNNPTFPHVAVGGYAITVQIFNAGGALVLEDTLEDFLDIGQVDGFEISPNASYVGGTFNAFIDNTAGDKPDPRDFHVFTGLPKGIPFRAEIVSAQFDTLLGLFNASGQLIAVNDDIDFDNDNYRSAIDGVIGPSGQLIFAVSGTGDDFVNGYHGEIGNYTLTITLIPEPAAAMTGLVLLTTFAFIRRR